MQWNFGNVTLKILTLFLYCHVGRDLNILVGRKEGFRKKKDREHAGKKGTIVFLK